MLIDVHTHICPPEIRRNRSAYFPGEDNFRLLYEDPGARLIGATGLVAYLDRAGLDAACAFGFPWKDEGHTRLGNDYVLTAARRHRGRVLPFACVDPLRGAAAVAEAERCLAAGALGLGEIATYQDGLGPRVRDALAPLAELCREADVPLLLHVNEPVGHRYPGKSDIALADVYELIRAHPGTRWILAHWGGGLFLYQLLKKEVDAVLDNVWYDTAAAPFLYKPSVYREFCAICSPERLLFGSDFPLLGLDRYRADMLAAGLDEEQLARVLGGNAAALLGLGEAAC